MNLTINQAANILGKTDRRVRQMCEAGKLTGAFKVGSAWLIPQEADVRLYAASADQIAGQELSNVPAAKKDEAIYRLGLIAEFERFCGGFMAANNAGRCDAITAFCNNKEISVRTFQRWLNKLKVEGIIGLVDSRGGQRDNDIISDDAFELFKSLYLDQRRPSVKSCWQNVRYINNSQGKKWTIPSLPSMYRIIDNRIPKFAQVLHREGMAAYEAKCAPYIETDPDSIEPGSVWIGDHHQFNCWVRYRNNWVRPWITAWMDMRSRCIVGRHISVSPNQTTILLAAKRGIEKYGPPESVKIDNGKDYDSAMWTGVTKVQRRAIKAGYIDEPMVTGIYAMMGIGISFAKPYHPQAKAIERLFDTVDCQFTKTFKTYLGKESAVKPDYIDEYLRSPKAIDEGHTLDEFTEAFDRYAEVYNNSSHSGRGMEEASPNQVMSTRQSRRVLQSGVLELLCRVWSQELIVGKNGIRFKGIFYGQYDMDLMVHQGKKVRAAYDPDDMRQLSIYDASTMKLICAAQQSQLIKYGAAVNEDALREAMRKKSRAVKVAREYKDSRLTANMDLTDLTIKAMADAALDDVPSEAVNLKPVATVMDDQVKLHERLELQRLVKKACGAEATQRVLNMDLLVKKSETSNEKLFKGKWWENG